MRRLSGVAIAFAIGSVAAVAPIWISIQIAWDEALANAESRVQNHASILVHRGEEADNQLKGARSLLNDVHFPPCSAEEVALMQQLAVTSKYIQAVGRISGNQLTCSSLGTAGPLDIGPADLFTEDEAEERFNVWIFKAQVRPLFVISKDGLAFIVDSSLMEDLPDTPPDISVGIFVPSAPQHDPISTSNGVIQASWLRTIPKGTSSSFIDDGYVVSVVRAQQADIAAVAAYPSSYIWQQLRPFLFIFIAFGLLCAGGLAWAVAHISRLRMSLPSLLRKGAKHKEFFVEYQPIVDLESRRWVGAEALVRWRRDGRVVRPDEFIPAAEESGVITLITACVAGIVAKDLSSLLKIDTDFYVAINLSGPDLLSTETVNLLRRVITTSHARPCNLHVEATERCFLQADHSRWMIALIRSMGMPVAIDDFGTGYSSLSCLQTLGLDALKIDKAFVETIGTDGATSQVVPHIIEMAHSLELTMIAEGIETPAQVEFLRGRGVRFAQGWLFGKPMNLASFCASLSKSRTCEKPEVIA
ncbi:MAG: EAL domain-containing protein [Terracidiphilus sp.]